MTARERYEQFCGFLGVDPAWPDQPLHAVDQATARAWERLNEAIETEVQQRVTQAIMRRDEPAQVVVMPDPAESAKQAQAFDPEG